MGRVAAPDRARTFADRAFSLLAAGLGLALLVATGRHLFGAPSLDQPDRTLAPITAAAVVPAPERAEPTSDRAKGSPTVRVSNVIPVRTVGTRTVNTPLASRGKAGASRRQRANVGAAKAASPRAKPRVNATIRPHRAAVAARLREFPGRVARLLIGNPHPASAASGARRSYGTATPRNGVRIAGATARGHIVRRRPEAPEASIIEPPLGYEARPTLVLVPGAAQLELGESMVPTIRSRRRH